MGKRERGATLQLDSLLDIMTCLLGCLMLMIMLTGVDATQIKVLIPTPMEHRPAQGLRPIFLECRNDRLYRVPVEEFCSMARTALENLAKEVQGDMVELLRRMGELDLGNEDYRLDPNLAGLGLVALVPRPESAGYALPSIEQERRTDWYGRILDGMDKQKQMLAFLVRDDSYGVFKRARALAWTQKIEVSYELLDMNDVIKFGLGGERILPQ